MNTQSESLLDRYLDNALERHELADFEQRLKDDPALRSAIERQAKIDASVRRLYTPPAAVVPDLNKRRLMNNRPAGDQWLRNRNTSAASSHRRRVHHWVRRVAVATVLVLGVIGIWNTWRYLSPPAHQSPSPVTVDVVGLYVSEVENGFEPEKSMSRQQLEEFLAAHYYRDATVGELPEQVELLGLSRRKDVSRRATAVFLTVDSEPVILLLDHVRPGIKEIRPRNAQVHVFRYEIGRLLVFEVTPHEQSAVGDWLHIQDVFCAAGG